MRMQTKRPGFTLIELMVAMALTLFIMTILSQAFVMSIETFSGMKGIGDMQQNLRTASTLLRDDLIEDHFEGKRRLSDRMADGPFGLGPSVLFSKPQQGFFAVYQKSVPVIAPAVSSYVNEGNDASGMPSYRATDHLLYMTVKRKGNRTENFFSSALLGVPSTLDTFFKQPTAYNTPWTDMPYVTMASVYPGPIPTQGFYNSQWAEVLYFLMKTGTTEEPNNPASVNGTPTFGLYRAQFGMLPDVPNAMNTSFLAGLESSTFAALSCNASGGKVKFYTPTDAASGTNRVVPNLIAFTPNPRILMASTLVLPNVTSFHIQVKTLDRISSPIFVDVPVVTIGTTNYLLYDTTLNIAPTTALTGSTDIVLPRHLKGIQITLRVWDPKTRLTRQITVVQDL